MSALVILDGGDLVRSRHMRIEVERMSGSSKSLYRQRLLANMEFKLLTNRHICPSVYTSGACVLVAISAKLTRRP